MPPYLPPDPAEISTRSERSAFAEAIPPGGVTAPCRGPVLVCAYYDDPWKTPVTMAPLRVSDLDGVVTDGEIRTQGLPSYGMQDGDDGVPDVYAELGRASVSDARRGAVVAALVPDPAAPAQIEQLEAQIIEDLRKFAADMETALQPWVRDWEKRGWWGAISNLLEGAKSGATAWWEGEGDFWGAIWDWISSLPELVGEAWDSMTEGAKALWENKEKILKILEDLAKGLGTQVKLGLQALLALLANFPDLKDITDTLRMLIQQSAEWMGALHEMTHSQVPAVLAATFMSVIAATTPNFWTEMVGQAGGFILPEIMIGILFGVLATFTGGTAGPALAQRLTAFTVKVARALDAAGAAGRVAKTIFTKLTEIKDKMIQLVIALKRNIAEVAKGVTDDLIRITRRSGRRIHPPKDVPCFNKPPGVNDKDFMDQLQEQENAINNSDISELIARRNAVKNLGTGALRDRGAQQVARSRWLESRALEIAEAKGIGRNQAKSIAQNEATTLDATHVLDIVAGGHPSAISGLQNSSVNRSIGSQWAKGGRVDALDGALADHAAKGGKKSQRKTEKMLRVE